ncbi:Slp family lipoprotein [Chiayiivirga flava]|uniref:Outer membrane lipoprotein n=1 Tax=Chiayiivirga flava TaxID=659595 RepID=A0A7W8FZP1_9GAMM|nr:Slp family lipoprotein [Chiayiivirga flava]MBB5206843.1 outer membrane lipoprotein [Chiayiivirga flava]
MNALHATALSAVLAALAGCAAAPAFEQLPATSAPSPYAVADAPERFADQPVVWGGMILDVKNFASYSEIEILAFPLDDRQQPLIELADQGRFVAIAPGYVEGEDFAAGRYVSLIGTITGGREAPLRNTTYYWPEVALERLKVWPRDFRHNTRRFSVGIGISGGL